MEITLAFLIAAISGLVEALKRSLRKVAPIDAEGKTALSDETLGLISFIASIVFGIASIVIYPQVLADPVLANTPFNTFSLINVLVVGVALAMGAKGLYFIIRLSAGLALLVQSFGELKKAEAKNQQDRLLRAISDLLAEDEDHDEEKP